jgi:rare lipoprotein A
LNNPRRTAAAALLVIGATMSACATAPAPQLPTPPPPPVVIVPPPVVKPAPTRIVHASWYGPRFAGRRTSNGERFNPNKLTAASTTIPMGSIVRVINIDNGRMVDVRINDCGPFVPGRSLDLSRRAAKELGMAHKGVASVKLVSISTPPDPSPPCNF